MAGGGGNALSPGMVMAARAAMGGRGPTGALGGAVPNPMMPPSARGPMAGLAPNPIQGGGSPLPSPPPAGPDTAAPGPRNGDKADTSGPFGGVHANLNRISAAYDTGKRAQQILDHVREELDGLMDMGDIVRPEDVVASAGRLVGKGLGAQQLAELLSSMPTVGGEGLASWVRMHDMTIRQAESNLERENSVVRSRMGVAAFKSLVAGDAETSIKGHAASVRRLASSTGPAGGALGANGGGTAGGSGPSSVMPTSVMQVSQPTPEESEQESEQ